MKRQLHPTTPQGRHGHASQRAKMSGDYRLSTAQAPQREAITYRHPAGLFEVAVPAGDLVEQGSQGLALRVQSRHGYVMTLQEGAADPSVPLVAMMRRLESRYLGDARAWRQKIHEAPVQIAGLRAYESFYEGERTRWRVVIARGAKTDFIFMFYAPPDAFEKLNAAFGGMIASFRPSGEELKGAMVTPAPSPKPAAIARKVVPPPTLLNSFEDPTYGYAMSYPGAWQHQQDGPFAVVFSGPEGSPDYYVTVSVQNVQFAQSKTPVAAAEVAYDSHKSLLEKSAKALRFDGETAFNYDRGGVRLKGQTFLARYDHGGMLFRKWAVVLPNPTVPVAHIWDYTAPDDRFDTYRPVAEAMLKAWSIHGTEARGKIK